MGNYIGHLVKEIQDISICGDSGADSGKRLWAISGRAKVPKNGGVKTNSPNKSHKKYQENNKENLRFGIGFEGLFL